MTRRLADAKAVSVLVARLAGQISRHNRGVQDLALVGIKRRGVPIAERLAARLSAGRQPGIPVGAIDITLYRDDLQMVAETPIVRGSEIGFDINGRTLVLVDDVVFTGRTIRAALSELLDFGRPRAIQLAALVDRGHRELPIQPDFVARVIKTRRSDLVDIFLKETDGRDEIVLTKVGQSQKPRAKSQKPK
ncbi:bifunctional pyr operon transcriptional regulator/uracil phosphoribosyltransferase PyrR [candidate division WOR-3 bacterium]|uniref:Bifunctional protein PyrR n=1 Tax=candidate division WOR-3 bacterium TaxID=2052148 RepID=A0A937XE57_UNCW3|nr:bifunctional pyr operon transcriptional regulator/uracil phosphoribosyltransferase PyrR [candidate division WOR-3 bacterium]